MNDNERDKQLRELVNLAMDCMGVAVTIIDAKGTLLYYNRHSAEILDRKPEYIGTDIHSHHKEADSNKKVDLMLKEFEKGRKDPFHYEAKPYGKIIFVTLSPIIKDEELVGCVQTVRPIPDKLSRSQRSGDPARGVPAKPKSRFIGELNIDE